MNKGEMKTIKKWERADWFDVVSMLLIAISLLFSVFRFQPVFTRLGQALRDFGLSFVFYFTELPPFNGGIVTPTVGEIPEGIESVLPLDLEVFRAQVETFGNLLIDKENLQTFFVELLYDIAIFLSKVLMFAPFVIALILLISLLYQTPNNNYGQKTKPRLLFEKVEKAVWLPLKKFVKRYVEHLKEFPLALRLLAVIWIYNFNLITIFFELFAFLFYFCHKTEDIVALYAQLVKLVCDLSVPIGFLPWWALALIGLKIFDVIRKNIGTTALRLYEARNREFLTLYICALFITGKQRAKKTSILTDMKLTIERIQRDKAQEKFRDRDMQFPHFDWIKLERLIRKGQKKRIFVTLDSCRRMIRGLKHFFKNKGKYNEKTMRQIQRRLRRRWGYTYKDFIFEYDYERYGLEYNNGIVIVDIFEALEKYAQLYLIYQQPTPLDTANYSIREDLKWSDLGNFPIYDGDFFNRDPKEMGKISMYSHIIDYDAFRPGKVFDEKNPNKDAVEYGIGVAAEFAKERGNRDTKRGLKPTAEEANQENDLFEIDVKMRGHAATIDNYTFFRWLFDDQRSGSLGANNKDLTNICYVKEVSDPKIVMPGFMFEEWLYHLATAIFEKIYYKLRHLRGDANNTLLVYLLKKIYAPIYNHYWRVFNNYSVYTAYLRVTDGMDGEILERRYKYYLATKKTYANRFATDSYNGFYAQKAARSKIGLNQMPMYAGVRPTYAELKKQNSYFVEDISEAFGVQKKIMPGAANGSDEAKGKSKRSKNG